jgi:hypothetical protein
MIYVLLLVGGAALYWFFGSRTLFKLSIRNGEVLVVSGRVPVRFLQDVREVTADEKLTRGTVSAVARAHGAGLSFSGLPEGPQQRLRNAFRLYPVADVRHAPPIAKPTLGQMLGITWLAWLLESRIRH